MSDEKAESFVDTSAQEGENGLSSGAADSCGEIEPLTDQISDAEEKDVSNERLAMEIEELKSTVRELQSKLDRLGEADGEEAAAAIPNDSGTKGSGKKSVSVLDVVFYLAIAAVLLGIFFVRSSADGQPVTVAGYSAFMVKTGSMQSEIPQGALVITKSVDAETLNIGDDITYMVNATTSITHRIVGIIENYGSTGERAFETQGVMNEKPDELVVPAVNVIGKVVFHSALIGAIVTFIALNWPIILFIAAIFFVLLFVLKKVLGDEQRRKS